MERRRPWARGTAPIQSQWPLVQKHDPGGKQHVLDRHKARDEALVLAFEFCLEPIEEMLHAFGRPDCKTIVLAADPRPLKLGDCGDGYAERLQCRQDKL